MKSHFSVIFFLSFSAFAGGTSGGGGKGVVCLDSKGQETVELLDIWEARTLFGQNPQTFPPSTTLEAAVDVLIERLRHVVPPSVYPFANCAFGAPCLENSLRSEATNFLTPSPNVIRLHGVELEDTEDSFELAKPKFCEVKQLVNYHDGSHIYIDEDRFQKLDLLNQAALIVHEALYRHLRIQNIETNSIRTRRAVGYVSAGHSFVDKTVLQRPSAYVECTSASPSGTYYMIHFWRPNSPNSGDSLQAVPLYFDGATLMGLSDWSKIFRTASGADDLFEYVENGKCKNGGGSGRSYILTGAVEFDRGLWIDLGCDATSSVFTVSAKSLRPGSKQWTDLTTLSCKKYGY